MSHLLIVLYSRAGCHLCDVAYELLLGRQSKYGFALECVDIDDDSSLIQQYGTCVPVVTINGKLRFRGRVEPALLDRLLESECR